MIEYLKELLEDLKQHKEIQNYNQKYLALETAVEILEKYREEK